MNLTRAQQRVMERLAEAKAVPYDERTSATFRFSGRGMARTVAALKRLGLIDYSEVHGATGTDFYIWTARETK